MLAEVGGQRASGFPLMMQPNSSLSATCPMGRVGVTSGTLAARASEKRGYGHGDGLPQRAACGQPGPRGGCVEVLVGGNQVVGFQGGLMYLAGGVKSRGTRLALSRVGGCEWGWPLRDPLSCTSSSCVCKCCHHCGAISREALIEWPRPAVCSPTSRVVS